MIFWSYPGASRLVTGRLKTPARWWLHSFLWRRRRKSMETGGVAVPAGWLRGVGWGAVKGPAGPPPFNEGKWLGGRRPRRAERVANSVGKVHSAARSKFGWSAWGRMVALPAAVAASISRERMAHSSARVWRASGYSVRMERSSVAGRPRRMWVMEAVVIEAGEDMVGDTRCPTGEVSRVSYEVSRVSYDEHRTIAPHWGQLFRDSRANIDKLAQRAFARNSLPSRSLPNTSEA